MAGVVDNRAYQAQDDFSKVMGGHQLSVGANMAYARSIRLTTRTPPATSRSTAR